MVEHMSDMCWCLGLVPYACTHEHTHTGTHAHTHIHSHTHAHMHKRSSGMRGSWLGLNVLTLFMLQQAFRNTMNMDASQRKTGNPTETELPHQPPVKLVPTLESSLPIDSIESQSGVA